MPIRGRQTVLIRAEEPEERAAVHAVHPAVFGAPAEAERVDPVREQARPVISFVAAEDGSILGHILVSPDARPEPKASIDRCWPVSARWARGTNAQPYAGAGSGRSVWAWKCN